MHYLDGVPYRSESLSKLPAGPTGNRCVSITNALDQATFILGQSLRDLDLHSDEMIAPVGVVAKPRNALLCHQQRRLRLRSRRHPQIHWSIDGINLDARAENGFIVGDLDR